VAECAECGAEFVPEEKLSIGDILECPECAAELNGKAPGGNTEDEEDWLQ